MLLSWFEIFMLLAAASGLAYYSLWYLAALLLILLFLTAILYSRYTSKVLLALLVLLAAIFLFNLMQKTIPAELLPQTGAKITGIIDNYPRYDGKKTSFVLATENSPPYQEKLQVFCYFDASSFNKGDRISLYGDLHPPRSPGNPGEFDYRRFLSYNQIYYILSVKEQSNTLVLSRPGTVQKPINTLRLKVENLVYEVLPAREAAILLGMLLGKTEAIEPEQYSDFKKIGIVHVFAVSGLHVGFLLLLCTWSSSLLSSSRRFRFIFCMFIMLVYGTLVGWPISVIRAVLMAALGLAAYYWGRENSLLNSLGLAGIIILLLDPYAAFKISFQLSFAAAWGLVYLFPLLRQRLPYQNRICDLFLVPISAQLAVIPLNAYHFNLFSPIAVVSNVLSTYLTGGTVILGFVTLLLVVVSSSAASIFLYPAGLFIELILGINKLVLQLPAAFLWVAAPPLILITIYYAGLLLLCAYWRDIFNQKSLLAKWAGITLVSSFLVFICLPAGIYNRGTMEAVFVDVGQGDGILLKSPGGKFILVDGGGSMFGDAAGKKIPAYLHHRGIRHLFMLINTHPDTDHLQGLEAAAGETKVDYIAVPRCMLEAPNYDTLKHIAEDRNIPLLLLESGQKINVEKDWEVEVLYPSGQSYSGSDYNSRSLVLRVKYQDFSLILTGDIENEGMAEMIKQNNISPSTIIKVPHHGSKGSLYPEFYDLAKPLGAVISAGYNNNFGHPHHAVLEMLEEKGVKIMRTDLDGAISICSDGQSMRIEKHRLSH